MKLSHWLTMWGLDGSLNQENTRKLGQKWLKTIAILQDQELDEIGTWPNSWKCALHHWKVLQGSLTFHTYMTGQNHGKSPMYRGTFLLLGARHIITSLDMSNQQGHSHRGRNHDTTLEVTNKHVPETNVVSKTYGGWEKMSWFFRFFFKGVIFKNPLWVCVFVGRMEGDFLISWVWHPLPVTVGNRVKVSREPLLPTCNHPGGHCCCGATPLQLWHVTPSWRKPPKKLFVKRNPAISSSFNNQRVTINFRPFVQSALTWISSCIICCCCCCCCCCCWWWFEL